MENNEDLETAVLYMIKDLMDCGLVEISGFNEEYEPMYSLSPVAREMGVEGCIEYLMRQKGQL